MNSKAPTSLLGLCVVLGLFTGASALNCKQCSTGGSNQVSICDAERATGVDCSKQETVTKQPDFCMTINGNYSVNTHTGVLWSKQSFAGMDRSCVTDARIESFLKGVEIKEGCEEVRDQVAVYDNVTKVTTRFSGTVCLCKGADCNAGMSLNVAGFSVILTALLLSIRW